MRTVSGPLVGRIGKKPQTNAIGNGRCPFVADCTRGGSRRPLEGCEPIMPGPGPYAGDIGTMPLAFVMTAFGPPSGVARNAMTPAATSITTWISDGGRARFANRCGSLTVSHWLVDKRHCFSRWKPASVVLGMLRALSSSGLVRPPGRRRPRWKDYPTTTE
jgi:hypothetical protein